MEIRDNRFIGVVANTRQRASGSKRTSPPEAPVRHGSAAARSYGGGPSANISNASTDATARSTTTTGSASERG